MNRLDKQHQTLNQLDYYHIPYTLDVSQKDLSKNFKMGKATIERWDHARYICEHEEINNRVYPAVLGIDEHF